jgi:hypothetical protein
MSLKLGKVFLRPSPQFTFCHLTVLRYRFKGACYIEMGEFANQLIGLVGKAARAIPDRPTTTSSPVIV